MSLPTSSRVELALRCPSSWTLPQVVEPAGEAAERGTALHAYLADPEHDLAKVPEAFREVARNIDVRAWPRLAAEVAFSWDFVTDTATELGRNIGRSYATNRTPADFCGTADLVGVTEDSVFIGDIKTGRAVQSPPAQHGQLRMLALAAARAYGKSHATVALAHVNPETGRVFWEKAELDAWDLDLIAEELRELARSIASESPAVRPGEHCRYCPARTSCPSQVGIVRMLVDAPLPLTRESAAAAIALLLQVDAISEMAWKQIGEMAKEQPIELNDGRVYGMHPAKKEVLHAAIAQKVVAKEYGPAIAEAATTVSVSKAGLKDALRTVAKERGGSLAELEREALTLIGAAGGLTVEMSNRLELKKPKR